MMSEFDDLAIAASKAAKPNDMENLAALALSEYEQATGAPVEQPQEPGFLGRVGERLERRGEIFEEITAEPATSTVDSLEKGLQVLGSVGAGSVLDVVGESVSTGFDLLSTAASAVTPDAIEDPVVKGVSDAFETVMGTDIAQAAMNAAGSGVEAYQEWAEANPRASKNLDALANIVMVATPVKGKPAGVGPPAPTVVGRAGRAATAAGDAQTAAARASFMEELVRPRTSKKVREDEIRRTAEGGVVSGRTVTPSASEAGIARTLVDVPAVKPGNTLLQNMNAVQAEIKSEAQSLVSRLEASTAKISRPSVKRRMNGVIAELKQNPILVGDAARTAERTVDKARELLSAHPNTPAGVLSARMEFDAWVGKQRPKIFDPNTESALSIAVRETRQEMNNIIEDRVPDLGVRKSLNRQSDMFRAIDNIAPKAADEASTAIGRLGQSVRETLGLKREFTKNLPQIAGAGAVAGVGVTAPLLAAAAVGLGGLGLGVARVAMSPKTKRAVGALLRQSERAIQKAKTQGDASLAKKLRADRAAVIELMRDADDMDETEGGNENEPDH